MIALAVELLFAISEEIDRFCWGVGSFSCRPQTGNTIVLWTGWAGFDSLNLRLGVERFWRD